MKFHKELLVAINPTSRYIFIFEYIFKGNEIIISKSNLYSHVHCINIHSSLEINYYVNNLSICQQVKRLKKYVTYICEFYLAIKKERNSSICGSMDETGGPYAKWNKLEKDSYCMISNVRNLKKKSGTQKRCRKVMAKAWRVEEIGRGLQKVMHSNIWKLQSLRI